MRMLAVWMASVGGDEYDVDEHASGKKKFASLVSRRTRHCGHFRRHLLNSDANHYSTVHPDTARHCICLLDGSWQGIFLLDTGCQGIFLWTQPYQGIFLLDVAVSGQMASGQCMSWHRGYTGCQGTEHRSKYSCRIHKLMVGSRHSDSVQFYSLYLIYIYICYYHTSRFQHKHPASHPSPRSSHVVILF